ncbi:hypothetical protein GCM10020331_055270 [Ectobacillus funiculus]
MAAADLLEAQQKLQEACEQVKKELSETDVAVLEIANVIKDEFGVIHHIEYELTREAFERAIDPLIEQTIHTMKKRLLKTQSLISVIFPELFLAGGSSRIPLVSQRIKQLLNKEPYANIDPDTVVAQGAAIFLGQALECRQTSWMKQTRLNKKTNRMRRLK